MPPIKRGRAAAAKNKNKKKKVFRKKVCKFCTDKIFIIDYKDTPRLQRFLTEKGKIISRKINGSCTGCQQELTSAIKLAREIALLPYAA